MKIGWQKKFWNSIGKELIYGGHILSLGASGIVLAVSWLLGVVADIGLLSIPYLLTQIIYTLDHASGVDGKSTTNLDRQNYLGRKRARIQILVCISLLVLILLWSADTQVTLFVLSMAILGIVYPKKITKKILGFKNIFVSLVWSMLVVLVALYAKLELSWAIIILTFYIFGRFILSTVFFDIKDIADDKLKRIKTVPVIFGLDKTVTFLNITNLITTSLIILAITIGWLPSSAWGLLVLFVYDSIYINCFSNYKGRKLRSISYWMVDGEYIIWPILILAAGAVL